MFENVRWLAILVPVLLTVGLGFTVKRRRQIAEISANTPPGIRGAKIKQTVWKAVRLFSS
jgi:hypothetical protein